MRTPKITKDCESCDGTGKYNPALVSPPEVEYYLRAQAQRKWCPSCNGSGVQRVPAETSHDLPPPPASQPVAELTAAARRVRRTGRTPKWARDMGTGGD